MRSVSIRIRRSRCPLSFSSIRPLRRISDNLHVDTITLSYTFLRSANPSQGKNFSRFLADAAPDPVHGQQLFTERCTACHAMDSNKTGPMLSGVVGRRAGSAPGYHYSPALKSAGLIWSTDNLDKWLTAPPKFIPGARMPVRVLDAPSRRDLIAYLQRAGQDHNDRTDFERICIRRRILDPHSRKPRWAKQAACMHIGSNFSLQAGSGGGFHLVLSRERFFTMIAAIIRAKVRSLAK